MKRIIWVLTLMLVLLSIMPAADVLAASEKDFRILDTNIQMTLSDEFDQYVDEDRLTWFVAEARDMYLVVAEHSYRTLPEWKTKLENDGYDVVDFSSLTVPSMFGSKFSGETAGAAIIFNYDDASYVIEGVDLPLDELIYFSDIVYTLKKMERPDPIADVLGSGTQITLPYGYIKMDDTWYMNPQTGENVYFFKLNEYRTLEEHQSIQSFLYEDFRTVNINGIDVLMSTWKQGGHSSFIFNSGYHSYDIQYWNKYEKYPWIEFLTSLATLRMVKRRMNPRLDIFAVALTMFDGRTNFSTQVAQEVRRHFPGKVLTTVIPRNIRLAEAPSHGLPVTAYDRSSRGAVAYKAMAEEIKKKL